MKIVILDYTRQANWLCKVLNTIASECINFQSTEEMLEHLGYQSCDMLVMNWGLPDLNGTTVLNWVREKMPSNLPVVFITRQFEEDDILAGLTAGANDYLIEPLRREEVIVRVRALFRRAYPQRHTGERLMFDVYVFDIQKRRLTRACEYVELTSKEFDLALLLFRHLGQSLSRAFIFKEIWSHDGDTPSRTMDTHISRVRSKLQLKPENGFRLIPVYRFGYRLDQLKK